MKKLASIIAAMSLLSCSAAYGWRAPMRDLPKGISLETASAAEQKGDIARAHSDYLSAVAYYQRALRAGGSDAELYNKLGIAQLALKEYGAARKSFQAAIKTDPHNANALNNLGALMCIQKKYKSALTDLRQALELDEANASYHVNMAEAWVGLNQIDRAMTEYARAMELDPDVLDVENGGVIAQLRTPEQIALTDFLIAKLYARRGNVEGALDYLQRAKDGHYPQLDDVYVDKEFSALWKDPRLQKIVKP
ncbi:MAG: tetratricopeptide repeat protein [Terracidiphilus sp.]